MALITCPECGNSVSDKAEKCPQCAYPFVVVQPIKPEYKIEPQVVVKPKEGCFLQTLNAGCLIVVVIVIIIAVIIFFSTL